MTTTNILNTVGVCDNSGWVFFREYLITRRVITPERRTCLINEPTHDPEVKVLCAQQPLTSLSHAGVLFNSVHPPAHASLAQSSGCRFGTLPVSDSLITRRVITPERRTCFLISFIYIFFALLSGKICIIVEQA